MKKSRTALAGLFLSAATLVSLALHEGYREKAYTPVPGDVTTIAFGATEGVKPGDRTTPERALVRLLDDASKYEQAVKRCVKVPLFPYEYDAFVSLTYNIGAAAFCGSTLVRKVNAGDYSGACTEILRWDKFQGKPLRGLTIRRQAEYQQCMGGLQDANMGH